MVCLNFWKLESNTPTAPPLPPDHQKQKLNQILYGRQGKANLFVWHILTTRQFKVIFKIKNKKNNKAFKTIGSIKNSINKHHKMT